MRTQCIVGHDGLGHEIRTLRLHALIYMRAVIAVGPSVEAAALHAGEIVGDEIAAELVPLIDYGPQRIGLRLPREPIWIAQAGCEYARLTGRWIDFQDGRSIDLFIHAVLSYVAVGPHGHIQARAVA